MITDTEKEILLNFQRAHFALECFNVPAAHSVYEQAKENLKAIVEPAIAELVCRMSQEWLHDETYEDGRCVARGINHERAEDIISAEKDLYELSFVYGDNTIPNATVVIQ